MRKNQKGFSAIEAIIIISIIAVLAFGGWFVWQKNQDEDKTESQSTSEQSGSSEASSGSATPKTYLIIKEWNLRLETSEAISDAYYDIQTDKPEYAYLSVASLTNPECAPDKTGVGAITRYKQEDVDPTSSQPYDDMISGATQVGEYYHFFSHAQAYCDETQEAKLKATAQAFEESIKTAEIIER